MIYKTAAVLFVLLLIPASTAISAPPVPGDNASINGSAESQEPVQNSTVTNSTSEDSDTSDGGFIRTIIEILGSIL